MSDWRIGIQACVDAVASRVVSVEEIARSTLDAIEAVDPELKAFTFMDAEALVHQAMRVDARLGRGESVGPLVGVPVGVKDLFDAEGLPTSYGSAAIDPYLPDRDSTCVAKLRRAGALIVGKTRTAELAWSTTTPLTANPCDSSLIPGGSSGGSAAAVGAGLVHAGLGTDTGGSIRIPAALCGIVGIKPTYGLVGRGGVLPANWSLDTAGPLARSVDDVRLMLEQLVGHDVRDPASAAPSFCEPVREQLRSPRRRLLRGARLGVIDEPLFEIVEARARDAHGRLLDLLADEGVELIPLGFPEAEFVPAALLAVDLPEGAAIHTELLRARGDEIDDAIRALLHFAHAIPGVLVARAHQARAEIVRKVAKLFGEYELDALVAPANAAPAVRSDDLGCSYVRANGESELALWSYPRVFWLANLTGQPSLVVRLVPEPPPLGAQLIGRPFRDSELLELGASLEEVLPLERSMTTGKEMDA